MPITVVGLTAPELGKSISQWVKENTIAEAKKALVSTPNFDREPVVITDGKALRSPEDVKPFGKIEFRRRANMADAVLWALDALRKQSPVLTGRYVSSHVVMLNGEEIKGDLRAKLMAVGAKDRVQIVNPQPYARKIEGATANKKTGRGKRVGSSRQAKSGVYRVIHRALLQRFGRTMFIDFTYVKLSTGVKVWGDQGGRYRKDGSRTFVKRVQRDQVYPALKFFILPGINTVH